MPKFFALVPAVLVSGFLPFAVIGLKVYYKSLRFTLARNLDDIEKTTDVFKTKEDELNDELRRLDGEVSEIVSLYEITKAMSTKLLFEEVFEVFSDFLKRNFRFTACSLALDYQDGKRQGTQKTYKIEALNHPKRETIDKEVPLVSQDRVIGVLNVGGLEKDALEKFIIVARQFSLEMEKAQLYETVQALAITDGLTGVFVRRHFIEKFKEELERSSRHRSKTSFMMIDLDHFKEMNDRFGHLMGDAMLKDVARVLKQNVREIDLVGRYGGEEFCVFLPETDKAGASVVAERLRSSVSFQEFMIYDEIVKATISVGVSTFPDDSKKINELIEFADKALYKAKAEGRNRVVSFTGG